MKTIIRTVLPVLATLALCSRLSAQFTYTNNNPLVSVVPYGGTWTYSVSLSGGGGSPPSYYLFNLNTPSGQRALDYNFYTPNTFNYTFSDVSASDAGSYSLSVNYGGTSSVGLQISPAILAQPTNTICVSGSSTTMGIIAGPNTATFQWFNIATGLSITGTSTSPSFTPTTANSGETVYCKIYNGYGQVTSATALLTVGVAPSISSQPTNVPATFGGNATFSVLLSGTPTPPIYYQWYHDGIPISGANLSSITMNQITTTNLGTYTVVVSNLFGSVTSTTASLIGTAPLVSQQPASVYTESGSNAVFNVTATGTAPLFYQWYEDGVFMPGANLSYISLQSVSATNGNTYAVVISNALGSVTSSNATVNIGFPVTISNQPTSVSVLTGLAASFSVSANGTSPLHYQWKQNGFNIGTNGSNYGVPNAGAGAAGSYTVVITNFYGAVTSAIASLTVLFPPSITEQPVSQAILVGNDAVFDVQTSGTSPMYYQWIQGSNSLTDSGNIQGSQSNALSLNSVGTNDTGAYTVVVTNSYGSITSSVANLLVGIPPQSLGIYQCSNAPMLTMRGTPGFPYVVLQTTNLTPPTIWQTLFTNVADSNGVWTFTDTNAFAYPASFYQVTTP